MKKIVKVFISILTIGAWLVIGLHAQQNQPGKLNKQELKFLREVVGVNVWYLKTGKMAEKRAKNPVVMKFAEVMINEHRESNARLLAIAKQKGIELPVEMDPRQKKIYERLQNAKNFDVAYMQEMINGHKHLLLKMEQEKPKISDPDLKDWMAKMLPAVRVNTAAAEEILVKVRFAQKYGGGK